MTPFRARLAELPRPFKLVGGAIAGLVVLLVLVLGGVPSCGGQDADDPTTLEVTVERVTTEALPGYCAEDCPRWMVRSPYWYEVTASDAQVAELRSAGWTVNGVPADPTVAQGESGESDHRGVTSLIPWWVIGVIFIIGLIVIVPNFWNGRPG